MIVICPHLKCGETVNTGDQTSGMMTCPSCGLIVPLHREMRLDPPESDDELDEWLARYDDPEEA